VGSFTLVDDNLTRQRTANNRDYITHTTNGNALTSWEVDWTAPAESAGDITFYLSINDANGNGSRTGDDIYTISKTLTSGTTTGVKLLNSSEVQLFPNPTVDQIYLEQQAYEFTEYSIYDQNGRQMMAQPFTNPTIKVVSLPAGSYVLKLNGPQGVLVKQFLKD